MSKYQLQHVWAPSVLLFSRESMNNWFCIGTTTEKAESLPVNECTRIVSFRSELSPRVSNFSPEFQASMNCADPCATIRLPEYPVSKTLSSIMKHGVRTHTALPAEKLNKIKSNKRRSDEDEDEPHDVLRFSRGKIHACSCQRFTWLQ